MSAAHNDRAIPGVSVESLLDHERQPEIRDGKYLRQDANADPFVAASTDSLR